MRRLWHCLGRPVAIVLMLTAWIEPTFGSDPPASPCGELERVRRLPQLRWDSRPRSRSTQLDAEAHAVAVPTPENARKWLRILTAEPHVAGTPADYKTAVFVRDKLANGAGRRNLLSWKCSSIILARVSRQSSQSNGPFRKSFL